MAHHKSRLAAFGASCLALITALAGVQLISPQSATATTGIGSSFQSVQAQRIGDTRNNTGGLGATAMSAGQIRNLTVLGVAGIPASGVTAVLVDIEAIAPATKTYLTVYTAGAPRPDISSLNTDVGVTAGNTAVVVPSSSGAISIYSSGGPTHVTVDVQGYFIPGTASSPGGFVPAPTAARLVDTRYGTGGYSGQLSPGQTVRFGLAGVAPVSSDASAVLGNLTTVSAAGGGYLTAFASGTSRPATSTMNYVAGNTATMVSLPLGGGSVDIYNAGPASVQLIVDVQGYFSSTAQGTGFTPLSSRLADTRTTTALLAGETRDFLVGSVGGVPRDAALATALIHVTTTAPTASGYLILWPGGQDRPEASTTNFTTGSTRSNLSAVPIGDFGYIHISNESAGTVHVVLDAQGYWSGPVPVQQEDGTLRYSVPGDPEECEAAGVAPADCITYVEANIAEGELLQGMESGPTEAGVATGSLRTAVATQCKRVSKTMRTFLTSVIFAASRCFDGRNVWRHPDGVEVYATNSAPGSYTENHKGVWKGNNPYNGSGGYANRFRAQADWDRRTTIFLSVEPALNHVTRHVNMYPNGKAYYHRGR